MNKIYSWMPSRDPSGAVNVGHASMDIAFGQGPGKAEYVSWWPTEAAGPANGFKKLTSGINTYPDDVRSEGRAPHHTVEISCLDEERMRRRWADIQSTHRYMLFGTNCAATVADVLLAGGACLSMSCMRFATEQALWTPRDVRDFALMINGQASSIRAGIANGFRPNTSFSWSEFFWSFGSAADRRAY